MVKSLTPRQKEILQYIIDYRKEHQISPSMREIGDHFELHSPNAVSYHIKALEKKNYIVRLKRKPRSIVVLEEPA